MKGLQSLRKLAQVPSPTPRLERCELCAQVLAAGHQHLIEPATRNLICSCDACSVLFDSQGRTKYRRVPRDPRLLKDFILPGADWEKLLIPINLAFFYRSSHAGRMVALYPSPAGVTESLLELNAWDAIAQSNSALLDLQEDVEGFLVNQIKQRRDYYIAPIDRCFELVGILRMNWRGFTGGDRVWNEVDAFFDRLKERAVL